MPPPPLNFVLTRRQRWRFLRNLFPIWLIVLHDLLILFFLVRAAIGLCMFALTDAGAFLLFAAIWFVVAGRLSFGQLDILLNPERKVDLTFEEWPDRTAAVGIMRGTERWYLFLDGVQSIQPFADLWIIDHFNGKTLVIPASHMTDEHLAYLRKEMEAGATPEGFQKVVERGKLIQHLPEKKKTIAPPR